MNSKSAKMLLLFPPQWTPISPHFAVTSLIGQLKNNGYSAQAMDLNIDFYNAVLTKEYLSFIIQKIKKEYGELFEQIKTIYSTSKKPEDYTLKEKCRLYKFYQIKNFMSKDISFYEKIPSLIQQSVSFIRSKDDFYNPQFLINALHNIDLALELVSLAYAPTTIQFDSQYNNFLKLEYDIIKYFVLDEETNLFQGFFKIYLDEFKKQNAKFIAISLNSTSQLIPGLTLCHLLKKHTKAHVNIGGNFFGRITEEIKNHPEFCEFCDSISVEEGEGPIIELAKFINNEIKIQDVPNLIYFKNNKVYENPKMAQKKLDETYNLDLDCFELDKYFTPEIILPYRTSRGCYWGKCTFCDQGFGQEYDVKSCEKVVCEMKEIKEKYNIEHYEFIDDSVSPVYLKNLSNEILKNNINPSFFCDARLETMFDEETLKISSQAGLKMIMWGLESGSEKIMKSINKGIDLEKRFEILKTANKYNIWNFAFIFFGYPLETVEDARKTIEMLCDNHDIINSYGRSVFTMGKHAKIACSPEEFGIKEIYPKENEFSTNINFKAVGMTHEELNMILKECLEKCHKKYNNPLWMYLRYREWLFLYINKYGTQKVKNHSVIIGG